MVNNNRKKYVNANKNIYTEESQKNLFGNISSALDMKGKKGVIKG